MDLLNVCLLDKHDTFGLVLCREDLKQDGPPGIEAILLCSVYALLCVGAEKCRGEFHYKGAFLTICLKPYKHVNISNPKECGQFKTYNLRPISKFTV